MSNRFSRLGNLAVVAIALMVAILPGTLVGCSSEAPSSEAAPPMGVDLLFDGSKLTVVGAQEINDGWTPSPPPKSADAPRLAWELYDASGTVVASGEIADPRITRAEFDESGQAAPWDGKVASMMLGLALPRDGGELVLYEVGKGAAPSGAPQSHPLGILDGVKKSIAKVLIPNLDAIVEAIKELAKSIPTRIAGAGDCKAPINLLLISDGYTSSEMKTFHADAEKVAQDLFGYGGYGEHEGNINVWRLDVVSNESGAGDPLAGTLPDTAFGSSYGDDVSRPRRCLYPDKIKESSARVVATAKAIAHADVVALVVNATEYGGCAGAFVTVSKNEAASPILAHEFGHALFGLADEYADGTCNHEVTDPPNASHHLDALPWKDMLPEGAVLPTIVADGEEVSTIGAFEGAHYCTTGAYRPHQNCLMRSLDHQFCSVCRRQVERIVALRQQALRDTGRVACGDPDAPETSSGATSGGTSGATSGATSGGTSGSTSSASSGGTSSSGGTPTDPGSCFDGTVTCGAGQVCSWNGPATGYCCKEPWTGGGVCFSDEECAPGVCGLGANEKFYCTMPDAVPCEDR